MSYIISELLTEDQVSEMRSALDSSDRWIDGRVSIDNPNVDIKQNFELHQETVGYQQASSILYSALDKCQEFMDYTIGDESGPILFSRTFQGGYYKTHFDLPYLGDFSNTIFLSDPDEYSGGELVLMDDNRPQKLKLKAGSMVTYPCGTPHQVNEVTGGTREVAVFWTHSKFKNSRQREIYSDLRKSLRYLPHTIPNSVEESQKNPTFLVKQAMFNLERYKSDL
tara:strand:- start:297 stop:968 length:672 start_codon:yes stop_codon:yes gene_type:complete